MTRKPKSTSLAIALLTTAILLGTPAVAAQRADNPRDPISRIVKYLKKVIRVITFDDGLAPPKP